MVLGSIHWQRVMQMDYALLLRNHKRELSSANYMCLQLFNAFYANTTDALERPVQKALGMQIGRYPVNEVFKQHKTFNWILRSKNMLFYIVRMLPVCTYASERLV